MHSLVRVEEWNLFTLLLLKSPQAGLHVTAVEYTECVALKRGENVRAMLLNKGLIAVWRMGFSIVHSSNKPFVKRMRITYSNSNHTRAWPVQDATASGLLQ